MTEEMQCPVCNRTIRNFDAHTYYANETNTPNVAEHWRLRRLQFLIYMKLIFASDEHLTKRVRQQLSDEAWKQAIQRYHTTA